MKIRATQPIDLPFVLAAENHADNAPYITQCPKSWHEMAIASADCAHCVIESQQLAGYLILTGIQNPHDSLEIRRIVVTQKGQGYGREILRWIKTYAFEHLGHHRLWLDVLESNHRAKRLYESEGFVAEGIVRESFKTKTGYQSMVLMSILASEYAPKPASD